MKFKTIFLKIHLISLTILLINFLINSFFDINLASTLSLCVKIIFYISGAILFFYYLKPFKKIVLYFSIYVFSPIIIFFSWLTDGLIGALLSSFLIFFFNPNDVRFENDEIQIKTKFEGLIGMCCKYEVIEKKFFLFEKIMGEFEFGTSLYFSNNDIEIQKDTLKMHLILKKFDVKENHYIATDTTVYVLLK